MSFFNCEVSGKDVIEVFDDIEVIRRQKKYDDGDVFVKGLLGYGKGRVVFKLSMDVDSVIVFLNQEDGFQFVMFI